MIEPLFLVMILLIVATALVGVGAALIAEPPRPGWPPSRIAGVVIMTLGMILATVIVIAVS